MDDYDLIALRLTDTIQLEIVAKKSEATRDI